MSSDDRNYFEFNTKDYAPPRFAFPNLITPRKITQSPKESPKFSLDIETQEEALIKAWRAKIAEAARDLFPSLNIGDAIRTGVLGVPLRSGDDLAAKRLAKSGKDDRTFSKGFQVLTARSGEEWPPALSYSDGARVVELTDGQPRTAFASKFYTGVFGHVFVRFQAWENNKGEKGVTCYLQSVHSFNKGQKLAGGRPTAADVFKGHVGLETNEDPTGGAAASGDEW